MQHALKRLLDVMIAATALVVLSPLFLLLAGLVWLEFGRPVLFRQRRIGRNGEPFDLIKFRTMTQDRDDAMELKPDAERLTSVGKWMRSLSLDELPELINILKGQMSLIGPRPLLPEYLPYYSERETLRHRVRPGLTGLAQVNGRNAISWDERLALDADYVERFSLLRDFAILGRTAWVVACRKGISGDNGVTMTRLDEHRRELLTEKRA